MIPYQSLPVDWQKSAIVARRQRYLAPALGSFVAYDAPVVWQSTSSTAGPKRSTWRC